MGAAHGRRAFGRYRGRLDGADVRIVYFDIDSLRPDHLGCYGYHRNTSPNIDRVAENGVRFENVYASDVPCLPSRTALITGRFGVHNGVVSHGGTAGDPFIDGPARGFQSLLGGTSWPRRMRSVGMRSVTISTFGERHSAFHWYSGFNEVYNLGTMGMEIAHEVADVAVDWLERSGRSDNWFLHVNMWDPHTPYRSPSEFGDPFAIEPMPAWLTDDVRSFHRMLPGPHSANEVIGYGGEHPWGVTYPRQPSEMSSMDDVRMMFDGYDIGVRYADTNVGRVLELLMELGIDRDTGIVISADHGENLGELGVYGDHHTADQHTAHLPLIIRWPGIERRVDKALHYHVDMAATVLELVGARVPRVWDGRTFAASLRAEADDGRDLLVLSQAAWAVQRSVRFEDWLYIRTYHDAYHGYDDEMLFDVVNDPHEQDNLCTARADTTVHARQLLDSWCSEQLQATGVDPMRTVLDEGGGWHARGHLPAYLERLRATGRQAWAERLAARHGTD